MNSKNVFIAGLPDAGKTTFLAALWHLIFSGEVETALEYHSIEGLDLEYLNRIKEQWLAAQKLGRTTGAAGEVAKLNLAAKNGDLLQLTLPDLAGEAFRRMWEKRVAGSSIVQAARNATGHLLMINAGLIAFPRTTEELKSEMEALGLKQGDVVPFNPRKCPTAAILSDVLQSLHGPEIAANAKRVAIVLSAWDEVEGEGRTPSEILIDKLPLLAQFIESHSSEREYRVFGVSAQGGHYKHDRAEVLAKDHPSERIILVDGADRSHDLTRMLAWLLE